MPDLTQGCCNICNLPWQSVDAVQRREARKPHLRARSKISQIRATQLSGSRSDTCPSLQPACFSQDPSSPVAWGWFHGSYQKKVSGHQPSIGFLLSGWAGRSKKLVYSTNILATYPSYLGSGTIPLQQTWPSHAQPIG